MRKPFRRLHSKIASEGKPDRPETAAMSEHSLLLSVAQRLVPVVTYFVSVVIYAAPLYTAQTNDEPVLDELHLIDTRGGANPNLLNNRDVLGESTMKEVFANDYWGRPIDSYGSHKSWRPFAVLTMRFLNNLGEGGGWLKFLPGNLPVVFVHRMINVLIHAALAQMVGCTARLLFPTTDLLQTMILSSSASLLFALHPTHVEAVANAANRPHLLALLSSFVAMDLEAHFSVCLLALVLGFLSSETIVFQAPAIIATMTVAKWQRMKKSISSLWATMKSLIPRYLLVTFVTLAYLLARHVMDTLSIPDGLIQKAENPFYHLTGMTRVLSYAYVLSVHVAKSLCLDPVGFSHEYNFDCVPRVDRPDDARLLLPLSVCAAFALAGALAARGGLEPSVTYLVAISWLVTLFPVSGIVKVGTFIADRMAVPSSVVASVIAARTMTLGMNMRSGREEDGNLQTRRRKQATAAKLLGLLCILAVLGSRVVRRTKEWTSSLSLFQSSLKICPRSAKALLQMSKVHSGTIAGMLDLDLALSYIRRAEKVDPEFCKVHFQFAHVYFQKQRYLEFERRLAEAVVCSGTTDRALALWNQYWPLMENDKTLAGREATKRKGRYVQRIKEAMKADTLAKVAPQGKGSGQGEEL